MSIRVLPFLAGCSFLLPISGLSIAATAASVQAAEVACSPSNVTGSTDCLGALDGNDSNSDLSGSFGFETWTEVVKLDSRSGTAGGLTVSGNGQSGQYTITGLDANATYMVALKGGPSYSLYYLGSGQTSFSGTWNTNGLAKGNGTPGPDLSHFTVYQTAGSTAEPVSEPSTAEPEPLTQETQITSAVDFSDVTANYWASTFITRLTQQQIVQGFPNGQFLPDSGLTVAQFAAIVSQSFEVPVVRETTTIRGVSRNYWAYSALQKAYQMGFLNLSGDLNPEAGLTRLEMLVQLAQALGYTEVSSNRSVEEILSVFTDVDTIPAEYRVIIAALVERGVLVNYPNVRTLNLFETVSRAEGSSLIYQALVAQGQLEAIQSDYIVNETNLVSTTTTTTTTTTTETETETEAESMASGDVIELSNGYRITFLEVVYGDTSSTWRYYMEELPVAQDLSNWVLGLPSCATVTSATPQGELVDPDPNAQISGIKWQPGGGFVEGEFSVTLAGNLTVGQIQVAAKGPDVVVGSLSGPSCP